MWTDPLFADCADAARNSGMRSAISVPVMLDQDECVGSLAAQFRHVHEPCHEDVARLSMFARLVSMLILTDIQKQTIGPEEWVARELVVGPLAA